MHPDLFSHDPPPSSSGYPMITYMYTHPVASNLPTKLLVARWLQTNTHVLTHAFTRAFTHTHAHSHHTRLRLLLQQLNQGELPNVLEMKKTLSYAADVLLGLVPRPMTEEENEWVFMYIVILEPIASSNTFYIESVDNMKCCHEILNCLCWFLRAIHFIVPIGSCCLYCVHLRVSFIGDAYC